MGGKLGTRKHREERKEIESMSDSISDTTKRGSNRRPNIGTGMREREIARGIAQDVAEAGGRVYFVGGVVRDRLMGMESKDIDIEVYGVAPGKLREILARRGTVIDKGASFGVLGLKGSDLDIAMPRMERRTGALHTDFDVSVDPFMTPREASERRDFTINAMMQDVLTGEIVDCWGGREDLKRRIIRCVSRRTFSEDALRVFRAAQFAARLEAEIEPDTLRLCREIDVRLISHERIYEETAKALLKARTPSTYFRALREMAHLGEFFPELEACCGVLQNPRYHPEGDVFEHTMLVIDCAAQLRARALEPLAFMFAALFHDLGKIVATSIQPDGRITAYGHEVLGLETVERQMRRLTNNTRLIRYVLNLTELHMRPNKLAECKSKKKKTRELFDQCVCPEDLILLARADASGKLDQPYPDENEAFLRERLEDYRAVMTRPMVTGNDLIASGIAPGIQMKELLARARRLHFAGIEKRNALNQVLKEYAGKNAGINS